MRSDVIPMLGSLSIIFLNDQADAVWCHDIMTHERVILKFKSYLLEAFNFNPEN